MQVCQTTVAVTSSSVVFAYADEITQASKIRLVMNLDTGRKLFSWPRADGSFTFNGVPEGTHLLDVNAIGLVYPQVSLTWHS